MATHPSPRTPYAGSGTLLSRENQPTRTLLVGGDGIPLEEFLGKPVEQWVPA